MLQQLVRTTLSVRTSLRFSFQNQIWEDCCNRLDDVDSRPDAVIDKASIAIQIQTSGCQSAWSRRSCIRYGNYVHQIDRLDDHPPGLDAQSLYMLITCSGCATVQMTVPHRPDAVSNRKDLQQNFWNFGRTIVLPDGL